MKLYKIIILIFIILTISTNLSATEVSARVSYVSGSSIYLTAGRKQGITAKNAGEIYRNSSLIARIEVVFVADNSSSCAILEAFGEIKMGDEARIVIQEAKSQDESLDTTHVMVLEPLSVEQSRQIVTKVQHPRLSGRFGVQYYFQDNRNDLNNDLHQPSAALRLKLENLFDGWYSLNVRLRARQILHQLDLGNTSPTQWNNRIYEISVTYDNPDIPLHYSAGRVLSNRISGIGLFDGVLLGYRLTPNVTVGAFGGAQPDLQNTRLNTGSTKAGTYISRKPQLDRETTLGGTVALAGKYENGEINQEFLYEQINLRLGSQWNLYQSSELDINRGWRKSAERSSFRLSNLLLNVRILPVASSLYPPGTMHASSPAPWIHERHLIAFSMTPQDRGIASGSLHDFRNGSPFMPIIVCRSVREITVPPEPVPSVLDK